MTDTAETVSSAHITGCASQSISTDGTTAMIVFEIAANESGEIRKFALTLPVGQIMWLRSIVTELILQVERRGKRDARDRVGGAHR